MLLVLCRSLKQLRSALDAGVNRLYADFHDLRDYRSAVADARAAGAERRRHSCARVNVWPLNIAKRCRARHAVLVSVRDLSAAARLRWPVRFLLGRNFLTRTALRKRLRRSGVP